MQTWTDAEEKAFSQLMAAGRLERLPAIRLFRRCKSRLEKAMPIATAEAPNEAEIIRRKALGDAARLRAQNRRQSVLVG
jgi:hypothetical protein